jgi:hypothetical protein
MSGRDPDQVLDDLGDALREAWDADTRRGTRRSRLTWPRGRQRSALAVAIAALTLVPTAVATHSALTAPDPPPPLPAALQPPGAVRSSEAPSPPVYVGAGTQHSAAWRLSATACRYGTIDAVGLFLTVPGGGAGARCDVAAASAGTSPVTLAARRVQSYYDPAADLTWIFGTLPAQARQVSVDTKSYSGDEQRTDTTESLAVEPEAIRQGRLPDGLRVFALALPGSRDLASVRAADDSGATVVTCHAGRCSR